MAVAPLGVPDLSIVSTTILNRLQSYLNVNGGTFISLSGLMPDAVRTKDSSACNLNFALFHVTEDKFQRNAPLNGRAQMLPFQPMSLNLYYLLTAFCEKDFTQEQQAMSLALQFFYQTPIVKMEVDLPGISTPVDEEFVLSMEMESSDELSRLWQGITVPMRLTAIYKVGVVLLTPPATPALAVPVKRAHLTANPALFPFALSGEMIGTSRTYTFTTPLSTPSVPESVEIEYSPAVVTPGDQLVLLGSGLNQAGPPPEVATSDRVFLVVPGAPEIDVTQWKTHLGQADEKKFQSSSKILLDLPAAVGAIPAGAPAPGVYQIRAGSQGGNRTNAVPFSIAARIDLPSPPPNPPLLPASSGNFTLNGEGFAAGHSEVLLDGIALHENTGTAQDGEFNVGSSQLITFRVPAGVASGRYTVRVRVNGVESPPVWWIQV
jgi:hypothetical protein